VPYQFGIRNVVASLGTALTPEQVKLLGRFARKVVVNYDGDRAGVQAAKKAIEILLTEDLEVKVLVLPDNADPDEFIRKVGASEYQRQRGEAQPHIQFVIDQAVRDRKLTNPAHKEAAIEEVLPFIRAVRSRIQKREYFDIAMDSLRIGDVSLRRELWQSLRSAETGRPSVTRESSSRTQATPAEQRLLSVLFADEALRREVLPLLETADYEDLPTAAIFRALKELENQGRAVDFESLSEKTEGDALSTRLLPMLLMSESLHASNEHYTAAECVHTFRLMKTNQRIEEIRAELAAAEREGDNEKVLLLSQEQVDLARRRGALLPRAEAMQTGN
jgi:DNA primase